MIVKLARNRSDIARAAEVMMELRPQYTLPQLVEQMLKQGEAGYQVAIAEQGGEVVGVAGFVIGEKLAWRKHLYVDDLVTRATHRSAGAGAALLLWLKDHARNQGCRQLHLDSGVQRFRAHRFYLREGFRINSHHFAITDWEDLADG